MPTLCDANVLLALCYDRHLHHTRSLAWLDTQQADQVVLCRHTQLTLMRLLWHARIMGPQVCTLAQAWVVYDALLEDDRFCFYQEPEGLDATLRRLTQSGLVSPQVWQDAYLAAFACTAGLQLVTFDQGFRQFDGLHLTILKG
jgi:toxin-antitoxin system PIN domain toxin